MNNGYFPIRIHVLRTGQELVVTNPGGLPSSEAFVVLETRAAPSH